MDLGVLGYYRQMLLRSSDANENSLYFSTPPCRPSLSTSPVTASLCRAKVSTTCGGQVLLSWGGYGRLAEVLGVADSREAAG
jgi:hypothetical protein